MKTVELAGLALKTLKGRWVALPLAGFAIGAFCLCFAGAVFSTVQQEKSQPCELAVSAQGSATVSEATIVKLTQIPGVSAATPLLPVTATVKSGSFTAQLVLTGIDGSYLEAFQKGKAFPERSGMPYLVLNEAACRQFSDGNDDTDTTAEPDSEGAEQPLPAIDWLNVAFSVQTGDGVRPVVAKVCGILAGNGKEQPAAAYLSLSSAKELLRAGGQGVSPTSARIRVKNIGWANGVSAAVAALGLTTQDNNAQLQARWDVELEEMSFLLAMGMFSVLCATVLLSAARRIVMTEQAPAWAMLRWLGMGDKDVTQVFAMQAHMVALVGAGLGIVVAACLPSFLPPELLGKSIFMLSIPLWAAATALALCGTLALLSLFSRKVQRS